MIATVVVDVGNTRIKWGLCQAGKIAAVASLPSATPSDWEAQIRSWKVEPLVAWVLTGVRPARRDELRGWLLEHGFQVSILRDWTQLPIPVPLPQPDRVGIDRLLDAVAARSRQTVGRPAVIV